MKLITRECKAVAQKNIQSTEESPCYNFDVIMVIGTTFHLFDAQTVIKCIRECKSHHYFVNCIGARGMSIRGTTVRI